MRDQPLRELRDYEVTMFTTTPGEKAVAIITATSRAQAMATVLRRKSIEHMNVTMAHARLFNPK